MRGITITLYSDTQVGVDEFNAPITEKTAIQVDNVLVGEPATEQVMQDLNMYGKRLAYVLAIPKGDEHDWTDKEVSFFGQRFKTYGEPTQGIDALIPLSWNKKVKVEHYA